MYNKHRKIRDAKQTRRKYVRCEREKSEEERCEEERYKREKCEWGRSEWGWKKKIVSMPLSTSSTHNLS